MYENRVLNPDAITAELAYRRAQLIGGHRTAFVAPRGRWWRRRGPVND